MSWLLKNAQALVGVDQEIRTVDIRVNGDLISEIGRQLISQGRRCLMPRGFFIPGLVNAHLHPSHALSKGLTDGVSWEEGLLRLYALDREKRTRIDMSGRCWDFQKRCSGTTTASV